MARTGITRRKQPRITPKTKAMKSKDDIKKQYRRIMCALWGYDCRIPGNTERRNKRMATVNYIAAKMSHPEAFKR